MLNFNTVKYISRQICTNKTKCLKYIQGQEPKAGLREYFYYINHEGMVNLILHILRILKFIFKIFQLFLDDAKIKNFTSCFKEKKFLIFFFNRIKCNDTGKYEEFPFVSHCGRERNFIRCDDLPVVYTHLQQVDDKLKLTYGYADNSLSTNFDPSNLYMNPLSGRVYHPANERFGRIGLVRSKLAIELSKHFIFENGENIRVSWIRGEFYVPQCPTEWDFLRILSIVVG